MKDTGITNSARLQNPNDSMDAHNKVMYPILVDVLTLMVTENIYDDCPYCEPHEFPQHVVELAATVRKLNDEFLAKEIPVDLTQGYGLPAEGTEHEYDDYIERNYKLLIELYDAIIGLPHTLEDPDTEEGEGDATCEPNMLGAAISLADWLRGLIFDPTT